MEHQDSLTLLLLDLYYLDIYKIQKTPCHKTFVL